MMNEITAETVPAHTVVYCEKLNDHGDVQLLELPELEKRMSTFQ